MQAAFSELMPDIYLDLIHLCLGKEVLIPDTNNNQHSSFSNSSDFSNSKQFSKFLNCHE